MEVGKISKESGGKFCKICLDWVAVEESGFEPNREWQGIFCLSNQGPD